jgi:GNAT superfamily N-acetyltransferase
VGAGDDQNRDVGAGDDPERGDGAEGSGDDDSPRIRRGREGDLLDVLGLVEGALLEMGANRLRRRTAAGEVLVAEVDGRTVGALVREGDHVAAVAVHPDRRGAGVGRALIEAALAETGRLTAEFRPEVRPFYEKLGFAVEERGDRLWGERVK